MKKPFRTSIGGQALLEGVMMRGPSGYAAVVRTPEGLTVLEKEVPFLKEKCKIFGWVFIRGVCNFIQSMAIGMKTLFWSADQVEIEEATEDKPAKKGLGKGLFALTGLIAIVMVVGLFTVLPTYVGGLLSSRFDWYADSGFARNAAETGLRLIILFLYMVLASQTKDIKRTFGYHGAEHKAIATYEAGEELTVENVRKRPRFHPRCGTSFLLTVVFVSMVAFLLVSIPLQAWELSNTFVRAAIRLSLLPIVIAISYEINRLIGRTDNVFSKVFRAPGIAMQRITTNEPDDEMIEVAIDALQRVVPKEEASDKWGA